MKSNRRKYLLKIIAGKLVDLDQFMKQNPSNFNVMEELDREAFDKYRDSIGDFAQNKYDLMNDFEQEGILGVGIEGDSGKLEGHIYGYTMTEDEFPDFDPDETTTDDLINDYGVKLYTTVPENFPKILYTNMINNKIFYTSNLVLTKHRTKIVDVLNQFLNKVKSAGYKYIAFDALSDTFKLFMNSDFSPKTDRLNKFKIKLIALIPDEDSGMSHAQALVEI